MKVPFLLGVREGVSSNLAVPTNKNGAFSDCLKVLFFHDGGCDVGSEDVGVAIKAETPAKKTDDWKNDWCL